jgi:hypothetical protein
VRSLWSARVGGALLVWFLLVFVAHLVGGRPDAGLVGLAVAAGTAALWLCVDAVSEGETPRWELLDDEPVRPPGQDARLAALTRAVAAHFEARRPGNGLQRQLMGLADQRLVARYGVSWRADPRRARPFLGPELLALAEQSDPFPRMTREQVDVLLERIEAL